MHKHAAGKKDKHVGPRSHLLPPCPTPAGEDVQLMLSGDHGLSCSRQGLLQHLYKQSQQAWMVSFSARSHQPFGILERQSSMSHTWLDVSFTHICMQREAGPSLYFTFTHSTVHKLSAM